MNNLKVMKGHEKVIPLQGTRISKETSKIELLKKITKKKEFSQLPKKDIELAFEKFDKDKYSDEEKFKLTRDLLRKVFSSFTSLKLLKNREINPEEALKKHLSTRERFQYYDELYLRILGDLKEEKNIFDLGAGINGFSYKYFEKIDRNFHYIGIEAIGQLVELMNYHFKTRGIENCHALHMSLFEIDKIKKYIKGAELHQGCIPKKGTRTPHEASKNLKKRFLQGAKIVFLFKTIDSLEMLERNYSKKLISEISPLVDRIVVSFATKSMNKRKKFKVKRNWIINFIKENFEILDDFEIGDERYIIFRK
jgi:hypothetical protein|tara:strand:- start:1607 stop:2533 length:927 start_codon:yes stop_codon:yes gene_type:complete